jgi:hypothetical protein
MVAALPRHAKRQLRAACRAGRAAVDSRAAVLAVPLAVKPRGLAAAVARMPRLRSLDCFIEYEADCAEVAGALAAAPAPLTAFKYFEAPEAAGGDAGPVASALADAIASRPGLADLDLKLGCRSRGPCDAVVAAVGRLPQLRTLRLSVGLKDNDDGADPWMEAPTTLELPSTLQASVARLLCRREAFRSELACRTAQRAAADGPRPSWPLLPHALAPIAAHGDRIAPHRLTP